MSENNQSQLSREHLKKIASAIAGGHRTKAEALYSAATGDTDGSSQFVDQLTAKLRAKYPNQFSAHDKLFPSAPIHPRDQNERAIESSAIISRSITRGVYRMLKYWWGCMQIQHRIAVVVLATILAGAVLKTVTTAPEEVVAQPSPAPPAVAKSPQPTPTPATAQPTQSVIEDPSIIPSDVSYNVVTTDEIPGNEQRLQIRINKIVFTRSIRYDRFDSKVERGPFV